VKELCSHLIKIGGKIVVVEFHESPVFCHALVKFGEVTPGDNLEGDNVITIRRLQPGEVNLFRQLRLTALQDAPYAFPTTYETALERSDGSWREQAEHTAQGSDRATFIAFSDELPIGMAALYREKDKADVGELLQVWLRPEFRGTRVVWSLMDEIFKWAGENNFRSIIAGVTKGNARAVQFYTNYGFSIINEATPSDSGSVYLVKEVKSG
jgi:ribosomal protein S18 acetylase RimI-like enzyme